MKTDGEAVRPSGRPIDARTIDYWSPSRRSNAPARDAVRRRRPSGARGRETAVGCAAPFRSGSGGVQQAYDCCSVIRRSGHPANPGAVSS